MLGADDSLCFFERWETGGRDKTLWFIQRLALWSVTF